jgi:hypothetical protein
VTPVEEGDPRSGLKNVMRDPGLLCVKKKKTYYRGVMTHVSLGC